jgi:hypothetical protein
MATAEDSIAVLFHAMISIHPENSLNLLYLRAVQARPVAEAIRSVVS